MIGSRRGLIKTLVLLQLLRDPFHLSPASHFPMTIGFCLDIPVSPSGKHVILLGTLTRGFPTNVWSS